MVLLALILPFALAYLSIMQLNIPEVKLPRVVIVGCGFGGLQLAKTLRHAPVQVVLFDKNNYHTFQPLLYQVATAGLEADSIAYPIRKIFKGQQNLHYRMGQVLQVFPAENKVSTSIGEISYDYLVIATGTTTNFFGNKAIEQQAMPMKTVAEALNLRSLILQNFERALLTQELKQQQALITFMVVGGGPTGVELAGALCELKKHVLPNDYPELDLRKMRVILVENSADVLGAMSEANRARAKKYLEELGCEVWLNTKLSSYDGFTALLENGKEIYTQNVVWAAGIKGVTVDGFTPDKLNTRGRYVVDEYARIQGHENIFAIGDVACMATAEYPNGHPQVAPVAVQMGVNTALNIQRHIQQKILLPFHYTDKGSMATVGRNRAVVEAFNLRFGGFMGWFVWMALHLMLLVGFRNKVVVFVNWLWNYINYDRNIRLIIRPFERK